MDGVRKWLMDECRPLPHDILTLLEFLQYFGTRWACLMISDGTKNHLANIVSVHLQKMFWLITALTRDLKGYCWVCVDDLRHIAVKSCKIAESLKTDIRRWGFCLQLISNEKQFPFYCGKKEVFRTESIYRKIVSAMNKNWHMSTLAEYCLLC